MMSDNKIEDILARHELDAMMTALHLHPDLHWTNAQTGLMAHEDRATLLAEIERLRAENERLRENVDRLGKEVERADRLREEIARVKADNRSLVNRALKGKP